MPFASIPLCIDELSNSSSYSSLCFTSQALFKHLLHLHERWNLVIKFTERKMRNLDPSHQLMEQHILDKKIIHEFKTNFSALEERYNSVIKRAETLSTSASLLDDQPVDQAREEYDLNGMNGHQHNQLETAILLNQPESLRSLLKSNLNLPSIMTCTTAAIDKRTHLMMAAKVGNIEMVEMLLPFSNVEDVDVNGWRAIEHAVYRGHFNLVPLLQTKKPCTPILPLRTASVMHETTSAANSSTTTVIIYPGSLDIRKQIPFFKLASDGLKIPRHHRASHYKLELQLALDKNGSSVGSSTMTRSITVSPDLIDDDWCINPIVFKIPNNLLSSSSLENLSLSFQLKPLFGTTSSSDDATTYILGHGATQIHNGTPLWRESSTIGGSKHCQLISSCTTTSSSFSGKVVGSLCFDVMIIFSNDDYCLIESPNSSSPSRRPTNQTRIIGHRGLGMNKPFVDGTCKLQLGENTVDSFKAASRLGADLVEFDVQLTSDHVPVIYHDWSLGRSPGNKFSVNEMSFVNFMAVHDCVRSALGSLVNDTLKESPVARLEMKNHISHDEGNGGGGEAIVGRDVQHGHVGRQRSISCQREWRGKISGNDFGTTSTALPSKYPYKGNYDGTIQGPFTDLKSLFKEIPVKTGFNIEIKYPNLLEAEDDDLHLAELNLYIDKIVECTNSNNSRSRREIVYSTFHCDAAIAARLKQCLHPVLFLTDGGVSVTPDTRMNSLRAALKFARVWNLQGIVCQVNSVLTCPEAMASKFHSSGLELVTYGGNNNKVDVSLLQRKCGYDAVIVDDVWRIRDAFEKQ